MVISHVRALLVFLIAVFICFVYNVKEVLAATCSREIAADFDLICRAAVVDWEIRSNIEFCACIYGVCGRTVRGSLAT